MHRSKLIRVGSAALFAWLATCNDASGPSDPRDPTLPATPETIVVSRAVSEPIASLGNVSASSAAISGSSGGTVYVALAVGEQPDWQRLRLGNRTSGLTDTTSYPVVDGGVDPIGIAANVGDTLQLDVMRLDGSAVSLKAGVPSTRAPRVVRTSPQPGRVDVAVNSRILVVFSEPVDAATLTSATVRLLNGSDPVEGTFMIGASSTLSVEFEPAQPLLPNTPYTLVVNRGVQDLSGDSLQQSISAQFQTGNAVGPPVRYQIAFMRCYEPVGDGCMRSGISVINSDGTGEHAVGDVFDPVLHVFPWSYAVSQSPSWSPDGKKIAFAHYTCIDGRDLDPQDPFGSCFFEYRRHIYVMNADGTGLLQVTHLQPAFWASPAWSPDGARILARGVDQLYVMNADGSAITAVPNTQGGAYPAWSPDGSRIAFVVGDSDNETWNLSVVNADGSGLVTLMNGFFHYPTWSPDGSKIMFEQSIVGGQNIREIDIASGAIVDVASGNCPAWSPDGSLIAVPVTSLSGSPPTSSFTGGIRLWTSKGEFVGTINTEQGLLCGLAWSPVPL
jgi:hypothetical protein